MFAERLSDIISIKNMNPNKVANGTGISSSLINYYVKGEKKPSTDNLAKIADFFNVSADYLLGRTDGVLMKNENIKNPNINVKNSSISGQLSLSKEEQKVLDLFDELEVEERMQALAYLNSLVKAIGEKNMSTIRRVALTHLAGLNKVYVDCVLDDALLNEFISLYEDGIVFKEGDEQGSYFKLTPQGILYAGKWSFRY